MMETARKVSCTAVSALLLFLGLCNALPINLENSGPDSHTQFLTGLVAVLLTVCSVVLLAGCLCCQRRNGFKEFRDSPVAASVANSLDHGHINPIANSEFTIFTPISPPHHNNNVFLANQRIVSRSLDDYKYGDIDVTYWFDGSEEDFPRKNLKYIKELGKGWFGRVVEGTAQGLSRNPEEWCPVAVRILEASASSRDRVLFLYDATIYRCGSHPNILRVLGRSLDTIPLLLLQEYCAEGDLKRYLRNNKATCDKFLSSHYPLLWCYQLTSAVKFLHGCRVTHPDLAARNCQLTKDLQLKLGDYGLSATLYPEDYYEGAPAVPLRWCAPETISYTSTTIQLKQITFEGNVWSLGVTLWEICECGDQPYSRLTDDEVVAQVVEAPKVRLPRPSYSTIYTDYLYRLMQSCWSTFESRSSIHQIELMLADLVQVYEHTRTISYDEASSVSMQDFDKRWESLKPNKAENSEQDLRSLNALNLHVSNVEEILSEKRLSASMNNLHGSLDNLLEYKNSFDPMESWLENVACNTEDMSYVKGLSEAIKDLDNAIAFENVSSDSSHQQSPIPDVIPRQSKLQFKLGQVFKPCELSRNEPRTSSSESETEDEAWRRKIERGAYSEKVRQKSRSVTDLMVLTHIDCSESDSETTVPSIDYKTNHSRNVRHIKNNMEGFNKFGSEGNLLSVQGTFQEELRKLQEERKDSLLFVPDNRSQSSSSVTRTGRCDLPAAQSSPVKKLFDELNSPVDIVPAKQVYNVFSVSVGQNYGALHNLKTSNQINKIKMTDGSSDVGDDSNCLNISTAERDVTSNVCNVCSTVNSETATDTNYNRIKQLSSRGNRQDLIKTWLAEDIFSVNEEELRNNKPEVKSDQSEALIKRENSNNLKKDFLSSQLHPVGGGFDYEIKRQVPKLADIIQNDIKLLDYIIVNDGGDKLAGYCELEDCRQGNLNSSVSIEDNERVQSSETSFLNFDGGESQKFLRNKDDCKIFNDRNAMRDFLFESHTQITLEPTTRETPVEVMLNDLNHKSVPNSFCDSHANVQESRIAQIEANDLSDGDAVKLEDVRLVEVASEKCLRAPEARTTSIVDVSRIVEVNPEGETQRKAEKPAVQKEPVDLMTSSKVDDLNLLNGEPNFITENRFGNIFEDVSNETIAEAPRDEGLEISEAVRAENKAKSNAEDPTGITSSGFHLREVVENDAVLRGDAERSKELEIISDTSARRSREKETEEARERPSDSESLVKEEQREEELNLAETSGPKRESHEETTGESLDATEEEEEIESEGEKSDVLREENAAETKTEKEESDSAHLNDRLIFLSATEEENGKETAELREDPKILNTAVDAKGIETNSYLFDGAPTLNTTEEEKLNVPRKKTETEEDAGKGEEQAKILNTAVDVTSTTEGVSNLFDDQLTSKADEKEKVNVTQEARLKKWVDASVKKLETSEESYDEFLKTDEKEEGANETAVLEEQMKILDAEELVKLVTSEAPESLLETDEEKRPMKIGAEKQENSREIQTKILNTGEPTRTNEEGYNDAHEITLKVEEDGKLNTAREQTEKEEDKPIFKKQMKCNTEEQLLKLETTEGSYDDKEDPVSLAQKLKCNAEEQLKSEATEEGYNESPLKMEEDGKFNVAREQAEKEEDTPTFKKQMKSNAEEQLLKLETTEESYDDEEDPVSLAQKLKCNAEEQLKLETTEEGYSESPLKMEEDGTFNVAREQTEKEEDTNETPIFKKQTTFKLNTGEQLKLETTEESRDDEEDPVSLTQKLKCNAEEQLKLETTEEGYNESPLKMQEDGTFNIAREQTEKEEDTPIFKKQMKSNAEEQLLKLETTEESYDDKEDPVSLSQKLKCNAEEQLKLETTEEGYNESPLKMEEDGTFNVAREQTENEEDPNETPIFKKQTTFKLNTEEQLKLETTEEDEEDPVSLAQKLKCNAEEQLKLETTEEGYNENPLKMEEDGKFNVAREQTEKEEDPNDTPIFKKQTTFKLNTEEQLKLETTEEDEEDPVSLAEVFLDVAEDVTGVNKEISRDLLDKDAELEKLNSEISRNKTKGFDTSSETIIDKLTQIIRAEKQIATEFKSNRIQTGDFLSKEVQNYEDGGRGQPQIQFDLSESQQEIAPNSLTHYSAFAGAPGVKRPLDSIVILGASDDYSIDYYSGLKTSTEETGELQFSSNFVQGDGGAQKSLRCRAPENHHSDLKYSLETWDNFLDKTFDDQNSRSTDFSNFSEEPQSLLFLDTENCKGPPVAPSRHVGEKLAFDVGEEVKSEDKQSQKGSDSDGGSWEAGEGWFLHPQTGSEEPTGQIAPSQAGTSESYVGFSMDDEIMTALRNELLSKLPHAQRASSDKVEDQEEPDEGAEKNEVFVRYNVYSTPLSPIPEETFVDSDESRCATPQRYDSSEDDDDNSDWSMQDNNSPCNTQSPKLTESPAKEPPNRHTPSQDSCCSNDTLFNLEELNTANDHEKVKADDEIKQDDEEENVATVVDDHVITGDDAKSDETGARSFDVPKISIHNYIQEFLNNERHAPDENKSENEEIYLSVGDGTFAFGGRQSVVAPLNSPEDKPWKELQASFRRCEEDEMIEDKDILEALNESDHSNEPEANNESPDGVKETQDEKNPSTLEAKTDELEPSGDVEGARKVLGGDSYDDLYGPLTDIRFSGPADIELMTTAFNEGADLMEEQDWDSGSDTRSSSSGEFIWREGEHEASVKALRAAPQSENLSNAAPTMEHIVEEEREESPGCTSDSEIEEECPEFVPSAWDKYATPTKSALRSPEKSLERAAVAAAEKGKKSKAVWFKKQKYHCVYEYPREPESPLLQSYDLWQPVTDYSAIADWDLDGSNSYVSTVDEPDCIVPECEVKNPKNLYHLTTFPDLTMGTTMLDEDFFISSSSRPFDMLGGLTSQFFPGKQFLDNWNENATPDSGVEDVTTPPVADSTTEGGKETRLASQVQSLKSLAAAVVKQNDARNTVLGGLRHTRNKLKLDLPPSPSAFTSSRSFTVEPVVDEEILNRQAPTFTTFGKSRFLVQQVDTTLDDDKQSRNVSFEAIPYRPAKQFYKDDFDREKHKVEVVKGEASLLDSADEDSGIESCTLERKKGVDV